MQQLPLEFRENYAKFWMSIIHSNVQGMQEYSEKLGVKELYSYFACMVSGRSMSAVMGGKVHNTKNEDEELEEKMDASKYLVSDSSLCLPTGHSVLSYSRISVGNYGCAPSSA